MSASKPISRPENQPVSFPAWKAALYRAAIPAGQRDAYQREILAFLRHCKIRRAPATIMLVKEYLAERDKQGANGPREALRWLPFPSPLLAERAFSCPRPTAARSPVFRSGAGTDCRAATEADFS